jgi:hypothetical protein
MKFENSEIFFELSRSLSIEQLHLKIRDELNWLRDTHGHNVKPRTIRSNGTFEKGVLQESGVIFKFCFKEGCRLLHLLDYIGLIGVTSMTLSSRSSCHLRQARNQIMSLSLTIEQLHLMIRDEFNRLYDTLDNNSHCAGEAHQHFHRAVARQIRPTIAEALISTDWTPATRLITTGFSEL